MKTNTRKVKTKYKVKYLKILILLLFWMCLIICLFLCSAPRQCWLCGKRFHPINKWPQITLLVPHHGVWWGCLPWGAGEGGQTPTLLWSSRDPDLGEGTGEERQPQLE